MAPKKETPDAPKTKRVMTEHQLEKLAEARVKARAVRQAMKDGREDTQLKVLQAKMDALKSKKNPPVKEEPTPEEPEPTSVPVPDEEIDPEKDDKTAKVEPVVEPITHSEPPTKKKSKKKPIVIVQHSESSDSDSDSNVIYIKKSSRKKKETAPVPPQEPPRHPSPVKKRYTPVVNPFFGFHNPISYNNFT